MGARRSRRRNWDILLQRLEEAYQKHGFSTPDDAIRYLKSKYYPRMKEQFYANNIRQAFTKLQQTTNKNSRNSDDRYVSDVEDVMDLEVHSRTNCDDASTSLSSDCDLMKSTLRECYAGSKFTEIEKNFEVKGVRMKKVLTINGDGKDLSSVSAEEVKGREGEPRFSDFGGMNGLLEELEDSLILPLSFPHVPKWLGAKLINGILFHGPPGCGKTTLARAIANETGLPFYNIAATDIVSGVSGASEENIRELFLKAEKTSPSIVFIDEIDAIASKRGNVQSGMECRIVTQLMTCMDSSCKLGYVLVIGATNRPDAIDPAVRRRFNKEILLDVPDESARVEILSVLTQNVRLEGHFDLVKIGNATAGFVGSDLFDLVREATSISMVRFFRQKKLDLCKEPMDVESDERWWKRPWVREEMEKVEEMENLSVTMADFEEAAKIVQPSSKREGFSEIPNVKWEDIGGLDTIRQGFKKLIVRPIKDPKVYKSRVKGFLLYGPPGCGKTLIAKAVANEAGASFIHIQGPELLSKYVGESELGVRTIFNRARTCSPCIIFFDEVDAMTTKRGNEGGWVVERFLNQLLSLLDGGDERKEVYVIGATNRPDVMDPALLRPGRFGKPIYVPLPSSDECGSILQALARDEEIDPSVDLFEIAKSCENFSGADLRALMNEAANAMDSEKRRSKSDKADATPTIKHRHFVEALGKITPSVSKKERKFYDRLHARISGQSSR